MSAPPTPATPYEELLHRVLTQGKPKGDRTGTGTLSLFGAQMRFDLSGGTLPLVTTKKVHFKSVVLELLWFLSGSTNVRWLQERGCTIWDEWADAHGELGPVYGKQWRSWGAPDGRSIDQMMQAVELLKTDPDSRRNIICSWNVADVPAMALAPCHALAQLYVLDGKLSLHLYQRSCDTFLGLPFNIASYSLLTHMLAQQTDLAAGEFVWSGGDVHLYNNHIEQARQLLERTPLPWPRIRFARRPKDIFSWQLEDFVLENYQHHPHIAAPVAV